MEQQSSRVTDKVLQKMKRHIFQEAESEETERFFATVASRYRSACLKHKVFPLKKCLDCIDDSDVDLSGLGLGAKGFKPVIEALFFSVNLNDLILSNNRLGAEGLNFVSKLLLINDGLVAINFSNNPLGTEGAELLGLILERGAQLEAMNMSFNELHDRHLYHLFTPLSTHRKLFELNLSHNNFGPDVGKQFGQCLANNGSLRKLDLGYNNLKTGVKDIALGLRNHSNLKTLILTSNEIGHECAGELGKMLESNQSIEVLDLGYNYLKNESISSMTKGIKNNRKLKYLNLDYNPIFSQGALSLLNAVAAGGIEKLNLWGVRVNPAFLKTLNNIKASNRKIDVNFGTRAHSECGSMFDNVCRIWTEAKPPLAQLQLLADREGHNLETILQKLHVKFLDERRGNKAAELKAAEEAKEDLVSLQYPRMESNYLIKGLCTCPLKVPQELAEDLVGSFQDEKLTVDLGEIILAIPMRISEMEFLIEIPEEAAGKKDAGGKKPAPKKK